MLRPAPTETFVKSAAGSFFVGGVGGATPGAISE